MLCGQGGQGGKGKFVTKYCLLSFVRDEKVEMGR